MGSNGSNRACLNADEHDFKNMIMLMRQKGSSRLDQSD